MKEVKRYQKYTNKWGKVSVFDHYENTFVYDDSLVDKLNELEEIKSQQPSEKVGRIRCFHDPACPYFTYEVYENGEVWYYSENPGFTDVNGVGHRSSITVEELEECVLSEELEEYEAWEVDEPLPSDYPKANGPVMDCGMKDREYWLRKETAAMLSEHPSKDAREFAQSVLDYLSEGGVV